MIRIDERKRLTEDIRRQLAETVAAGQVERSYADRLAGAYMATGDPPDEIRPAVNYQSRAGAGTRSREELIGSQINAPQRPDARAERKRKRLESWAARHGNRRAGSAFDKTRNRSNLTATEAARQKFLGSPEGQEFQMGQEHEAATATTAWERSVAGREDVQAHDLTMRGRLEQETERARKHKTAGAKTKSAADVAKREDVQEHEARESALTRKGKGTEAELEREHETTEAKRGEEEKTRQRVATATKGKQRVEDSLEQLQATIETATDRLATAMENEDETAIQTAQARIRELRVKETHLERQAGEHKDQLASFKPEEEEAQAEVATDLQGPNVSIDDQPGAQPPTATNAQGETIVFINGQWGKWEPLGG